MNASRSPQMRTRMFARVLGPLFVIACVTAVARASAMRDLVSDFGTNPLWPWVTGAFVLTGGLTIVALHQYWRNAAAVIVSLLGWLITLRGLLLLAFPATFMSMANSVIGEGVVWRTVCVGFAAIGLYLTYVGWLVAPSEPTTLEASSAPDLPRAA